MGIGGEQQPSVRVQVDPQALADRGINLEDLRAVLGEANVDLPKGTLNSPRVRRSGHRLSQRLTGPHPRYRPGHQCRRERADCRLVQPEAGDHLGDPAPTGGQRHRDDGPRQSHAAAARRATRLCRARFYWSVIPQWEFRTLHSDSGSIVLIRSAGVASLPSIAAITPNLLQITATSEPPDPYSRPPKLGHQLCQTPARTGSSTALRQLEDIEQQLRRNSLDVIVADFTVHPFQRQPPGLGVSSGALGSRLSQFFNE